MPPSGGEIIAAAGIGLGACALAIPLAIRLAWRTGIVDHPGPGYKLHSRSTPYLGGLAILLGALAATLIIGPRGEQVFAIAVAAFVICAIGTFDDWRPVSPWLRLALQAGVGLALWSGNIGWQSELPDVVDLVLTVGWILVATNA